MDIAARELKNILRNGGNAVLIDVREPFEFAEGKIDGAILIPLSEFEEKIAFLGVPAESEIIVYCQTGRRSRAAAGILENSGYKNVKNLKGGLSAYDNIF